LYSTRVGIKMGMIEGVKNENDWLDLHGFTLTHPRVGIYKYIDVEEKFTLI
jgi:hypothetical protein